MESSKALVLLLFFIGYSSTKHAKRFQFAKQRRKNRCAE